MARLSVKHAADTADGMAELLNAVKAGFPNFREELRKVLVQVPLQGGSIAEMGLKRRGKALVITSTAKKKKGTAAVGADP